MKILNDLLGYENRKIYQDSEMFNFTLDSILIARFINLKSGIKNIVDFGTNNAVIPLIISKYSKAKIVGLEIQSKAAQLAIENIELNKLTEQIEIVNEDIKIYAKEKANKFDAVICNPPFFKKHEESKVKKISEEVVNARHETLITLEEIIKNAGLILKNGGSFTLVHRPERTGEIINLMYKYKFAPKRVQFVHSKQGEEAKTILIDAILEGNEGMQILPPLIAHKDDESYTNELLKYFKD
ncbi:tRNA1(Val) (adenine(37)-N6)-methyltransferase [Mesoplasma chauliocola]|uniref:tRNA1(Val) (Adenine(37)-N6)-methyltransferase n=1 Tax=Mesoplasma chauliocola TaxID=216427 RepID=A0A249SP93_9MOLU|nr:tRNA1(Val) (adenine(37)-N6)-methyltransferase [Mesoplasma chauliocola]ASZ09446.1 tRNA1(Val) (adenine(37)-N6)-methyltransferase [Mesoplasma chauliocola]